MSKFTKAYRKWHAKNNGKYDSAREYHKALMVKFGDWQPPKPPKPPVIVPRFIADFIKALRIKGFKPLMNSSKFGELGFTEEKLAEILYWLNEHQEEYMRAWIDGYTVEKEKLYRLKNKITNQYINMNPYNGNCHESMVFGKCYKCAFTQSEIDEMEADSYEQIEVI